MRRHAADDAGENDALEIAFDPKELTRDDGLTEPAEAPDAPPTDRFKSPPVPADAP